MKGHGAFVFPLRSKASFLTLSMQEAEVLEPCVTQQGITLTVKAVIAFKVGNDYESITNAATRFLADEDQMTRLTGRIFAGHLRSIVGSMTVEDLIRERQKLAAEVLDQSKPEMATLGLVVDSLQIESIDDQGSGYIKALSQPHVAAVNQTAAIAQSAADQAAAQARQESDRNQAEYARRTSIARAQYDAEVEAAQAKAAQAGPLAAARAQQDVLAEQAKVAERNAELRQQQLIAEVVRPAEAEAERIKVARHRRSRGHEGARRSGRRQRPGRPRPATDRHAARSDPGHERRPGESQHHCSQRRGGIQPNRRRAWSASPWLSSKRSAPGSAAGQSTTTPPPMAPCHPRPSLRSTPPTSADVEPCWAMVRLDPACYSSHSLTQRRLAESRNRPK